MKMYSTAVMLLAMFVSQVAAEDKVVPALEAQLKGDLVMYVAGQTSPELSDSERKKYAESVFKEVRRQSPSALTLSPDKLAVLNKGTSPFTDDEIKAAYADLEKLVGSSPQPKLIKYFKTQFDDGLLNANQKVILYGLIVDAVARKRERAAQAK